MIIEDSKKRLTYIKGLVDKPCFKYWDIDEKIGITKEINQLERMIFRLNH